MKRFIYAMMFIAYFAVMASACGPGNNKAQSHEHGDETHTHDDRDLEHTEQEEFVVGDTTATHDESVPHDHDEEDHDALHEKGVEHEH